MLPEMEYHDSKYACNYASLKLCCVSFKFNWWKVSYIDASTRVIWTIVSWVRISIQLLLFPLYLKRKNLRDGSWWVILWLMSSWYDVRMLKKMTLKNMFDLTRLRFDFQKRISNCNFWRKLIEQLKEFCWISQVSKDL